jgi:hypothetical protein
MCTEVDIVHINISRAVFIPTKALPIICHSLYGWPTSLNRMTWQSLFGHIYININNWDLPPTSFDLKLVVIYLNMTIYLALWVVNVLFLWLLINIKIHVYVFTNTCSYPFYDKFLLINIQLWFDCGAAAVNVWYNVNTKWIWWGVCGGVF